MMDKGRVHGCAKSDLVMASISGVSISSIHLCLDATYHWTAQASLVAEPSCELSPSLPASPSIASHLIRAVPRRAVPRPRRVAFASQSTRAAAWLELSRAESAQQLTRDSRRATDSSVRASHGKLRRIKERRGRRGRHRGEGELLTTNAHVGAVGDLHPRRCGVRETCGTERTETAAPNSSLGLPR